MNLKELLACIGSNPTQGANLRIVYHLGVSKTFGSRPNAS